jgi:RNA polymerase sigma-70 factor (ECF subfamily)
LNQCRRHLKKRSRDLMVRPWTDQMSAAERRTQLAWELRSDDTPPKRLAAKQRSQLLDALLFKLPEAQADALRLRFFGGMKYHEIAESMQCSLSTAKNRVRWGLTKMAEYLRPEDNPNGESASELIHEGRADL